MRVLPFLLVAQALGLQLPLNQNWNHLHKRDLSRPYEYLEGRNIYFSTTYTIGDEERGIMVDFVGGDTQILDPNYLCMVYNETTNYFDTGDESYCGHDRLKFPFTINNDLPSFQTIYEGEVIGSLYYANTNMSFKNDKKSVDLKDFTFGMVNVTQEGNDYLGLGRPAAEHSIFKSMKVDELYYSSDNDNITYPEYNPDGRTYDNFLVAMKKAGYIDKTLYSLYWDDKDQVILDLGNIEKSHYNGDLVTVDLTNSFQLLGYPKSPLLEISMDKVTVGDKSFDVSKYPTLLDPGNPDLVVSPEVYDYLIEGINATDNSGELVYKCDSSQWNGPNISVTINNRELAISVKDLVDFPFTQTTCYTTVYRGEYLLLGEAFFKKYFTVFDFEEDTFSFGESKYSGSGFEVTKVGSDSNSDSNSASDSASASGSDSNSTSTSHSTSHSTSTHHSGQSSSSDLAISLSPGPFLCALFTASWWF